MSFSCSINTDNKINQIIQMLLKKNFNYLRIEEAVESNINKVIIIDSKTSLEEINIFLNTFNNYSLSTLFFLPKKFENLEFFKFYEKLLYPMSILEFEKNLKNFFEGDILIFKNIQLNKNGFILNCLNDKKVFLTDTEWKIVQLLFKKNIVEKEEIKKNVLNINISLDTKSLESHISRIRKKFLLIDSNIDINSLNNNKIKIN